MKRNLLKVGLATIAVALVVTVLTFSTSLSGQHVPEGRPEINPDCPHGCVVGKKGCWCYVYYPCYSEYGGK